MYLQGVDRREIRDLGISIAVYTAAFSIWGLRSGFYHFIPSYEVVLVSFLVAIFAFLAHELAHRYTAIRFGGNATYRMWTLGALIAIFSSAIGFLVAAVGAVYINGIYDRRRNGIVSLAGPASNELFGIAFLIAGTLAMGNLSYIFLFVASLNFYMGFFNLIPFPPLDGYKVLQWSREYYILSIAVALLLLMYSVYTFF